LNRKAIAQNEALLALRTFSAVQLRFADQPASCRDYAGWVRARAALEGNPDATVDERRLLDEQIQEVERATLEWLTFAVKSIADLEPESEEEAREFALFRGLKADLVDGRLSERIEQENAALRTRNTAILDQLRPLINNRLCLVGYTAAAVADMVNSPVFESMPGVMAHANVINTVIQNRFPQVAPASMTTALLLLGGLLMTAIAAHRGPWASLVSLFTLIAVLLVGGAALFRYGDYIVASIVPALTVFVSWAFVTLYRQLTEERHRRNLTKALGRSTSPAIAAEILRRRGAVDLSPRPAQVSCYFSDLQGFTDLSERLGPEDTQAVLNRYLEQMSGVLVPSHAFCKFMGDGIFAFFNAPLLPVKHHEAGACEVALRCVEALEQLKREQAMGEQGDVFAGLFMRAGVHAGTTYVGEFGSENQTDYTCIGDTVNLAARLEPANKAYGTQILVSSATRDVVGDAYEFRPLGKLQVKGKQHAVGVHELLGRRGEVDESRIAHARLFAGAIALFQERRFVEARQILASCEAERPHDPAAALYAAEIERHLASPPDAAWNQAIQLTTK
ncbi:MAG: adenylate/guanylate cyclase domain-containing protein, partial [bacterium]|nr:adenylate/guanylate cyclase domain-containing protein [bacterium]